MNELQREATEHEQLCGDIYYAIRTGNFSAKHFAKRISGMQATLRRWKASDTASIQMAGQKMTELIADLLTLAKLPQDERKWKRLWEKIEYKGNLIKELLKDVS
jgi:hypothetical protein